MRPASKRAGRRAGGQADGLRVWIADNRIDHATGLIGIARGVELWRLTQQAARQYSTPASAYARIGTTDMRARQRFLVEAVKSIRFRFKP